MYTNEKVCREIYFDILENQLVGGGLSSTTHNVVATEIDLI